MVKRRIIISILLTLPLAFTFAQKGLHVGGGIGATFYYGSITQRENMGLVGGINAIYQFSDQIGAGLSYNYNTLQASRTAYGNEYHFEGVLNAVDFHLYTDLIGIIRNSQNDSPVKAKIDLGAGFITYNASAYLNGSVDHTHFDNPPSVGSNFKVHFGVELDYNINDNISAYISLLGNYCLTSDVDAYSYYTKNGIARTPTKNDFYYTTTIGARYYFESTGFTKSDRQRASIMSNTLGFTRYSGKKTAKESFFTNNRNSATNRNNTPRFVGRTKVKRGRKLQSREVRNARRQETRYNKYYNRR